MRGARRSNCLPLRVKICAAAFAPGSLPFGFSGCGGGVNRAEIFLRFNPPVGQMRAHFIQRAPDVPGLPPPATIQLPRLYHHRLEIVIAVVAVLKNQFRRHAENFLRSFSLAATSDLSTPPSKWARTSSGSGSGVLSTYRRMFRFQSCPLMT